MVFPWWTPGPQPATSTSFLANIAPRSTSVLVAAPKPASEFDRFAIYEHGKDEILALEHLLLWWKVGDFSHYCNLCYLLFLLWAHQREFPVIACMAHDFLAIPGVMVSVKWLFFQNLCIFALINAWAWKQRHLHMQCALRSGYERVWWSGIEVLRLVQIPYFCCIDYFLHFHVYKLFMFNYDSSVNVK